MKSDQRHSWNQLVVTKPKVWSIESVHDLPSPQDEEVLVHSAAFGICGTDIEILNGQLSSRWVKYPCSIGHEWVGIVERVGSKVTEIKIGDRVAIEAMNACLNCKKCNIGQTNLCLNYDQYGFTKPGGSSEYALVPERLLHIFPSSTPLVYGILLEPMAVVIQAIEKVDLRPGESVGVIGLGTLGLLAISLLQLRSPSSLIAFGVSRVELEYVNNLGVTQILSVEDISAIKNLEKLDVVVVTTGSAQAFDMALQVVTEGGRVVSVGISSPDDLLSFSPNSLVFKDISVFGSITYRSSHWLKAIELVRSLRLNLGTIISKILPMSEIENALELFRNPDRKPGRIVVVHEWDDFSP